MGPKSKLIISKGGYMKKCGCKCEIHDVEKPTVQWIESPNFSSRKDVKLDTIVVHYTASSNLSGVVDWFTRKSAQVSAHYVVGRSGEIIQMVEDEDKAWHAKKYNSRSIGIEHVGKDDDRMTGEQEKSSVALIRYLMSAHGIEKDRVVGHRFIPGASTACPGKMFDPVEQNSVEKWVKKRL